MPGRGRQRRKVQEKIVVTYRSFSASVGPDDGENTVQQRRDEWADAVHHNRKTYGTPQIYIGVCGCPSEHVRVGGWVCAHEGARLRSHTYARVCVSRAFYC